MWEQMMKFGDKRHWVNYKCILARLEQLTKLLFAFSAHRDGRTQSWTWAPASWGLTTSRMSIQVFTGSKETHVCLMNPQSANIFHATAIRSVAWQRGSFPSQYSCVFIHWTAWHTHQKTPLVVYQSVLLCWLSGISQSITKSRYWHCSSLWFMP